MTACRPELWHDLFVAMTGGRVRPLTAGAGSWPADFFLAGRLLLAGG
jgi:hypothetical protein